MLKRVQQLVYDWDKDGRKISLYRLAKDNNLKAPVVYNARNALISKGIIKWK